MADPVAVGAALADIKARTGLTWREVGELVGTTGEYARKLATKPTTAGAGAALRSNVTDFLRTGASQTPVQRAQRVRQRAGAPSAPAAPRGAAQPAGAFKVTRSVFKGQNRDGWAAQVTVPGARGSAAGDREDARNAVTDAVRRAAQGRRRVQFRVTVKDKDGRARTVDVGAKGGYDAKRALRGINNEGRDPFSWLFDQGVNRYHELADELHLDDLLDVEVIALD